MKLKWLFITMGMLISGFGFRSPSWGVGASGLSTQFMSVKALGQANAFVAQADDPTAVYFNPAGLLQLPDWQITLGLTGVTVDTMYKGQNVKQSMEDNFAGLPHIFITHLFPSKKWALGLGISVPYGLATEWAKTSFARYVATESSLETLHYNPSMAYQMNPVLSLGVGVDYLDVMKIDQSTQINQSPDGDGTQQLEVRGGNGATTRGCYGDPIPNTRSGPPTEVSFRFT